MKKTALIGFDETADPLLDCVHGIGLYRMATRLHINADCPQGEEIRVELIDFLTGKPIAGYSIDASSR